jgi:hypothetical protein
MKGMRILKLKALVIILFIISLSCCQTYGKLFTYDKKVDGWLNWPPNDEFPRNPERSDILIIFVLDEKIIEAAGRLEEAFYTELTDEEYTYFTGKVKDDENQAYLVRTVIYARDDNGYGIFISKNNNLLISHVTMGHGWRGAYKWPIIILYDKMEEINIIYTEYEIVR